MQSLFNTTTSSSNTTTIPPTSLTSDIIGYSCLVISSIFYGANNLPVKHYETGIYKMKFKFQTHLKSHFM